MATLFILATHFPPTPQIFDFKTIIIYAISDRAKTNMKTIEFFHNKLSINSLNFMSKKIASKGFSLMISSVKGQCANHYTMEFSVIANIFEWT